MVIFLVAPSTHTEENVHSIQNAQENKLLRASCIPDVGSNLVSTTCSSDCQPITLKLSLLRELQKNVIKINASAIQGWWTRNCSSRCCKDLLIFLTIQSSLRCCLICKGTLRYEPTSCILLTTFNQLHIFSSFI